jgi:type I restriction enzyme S subunit
MSRKFQCNAIPSTWLENNGRRLDCGPYMSGAVEAKELIKKHPNEPLKDLTTGHNGGIFNGPRFPRIYVDDPEKGVPFLGSTDILDADLSFVSLLSKKQVEGNPALVLNEGWTLITCSGTIGRMAYARSDMKGMAGSQHFMRVVPDTEKIKPGYLYAYLSSRFGVPIVVSGTYGAIIQHIEPHHIANLPVPRLGAVEDHAHNLAQRAANNRVLATKLIEHAIKEAYSALGMIVKEVGTKLNTPSLTIQSSSLLLKRMDAYYYSSENSEARQAFDRAGDLFGNENLGDIADVWIPNIFKRLYAEDPNYGCPYFTGKAIYELFPTTPLFLKREVAQNYRLVLSAGMILIQDSGQISGLIGRPVQVGRHLEGAACTNNMVRIQTPDLLDNGYLFALLSTHYGIRLLKREASGSSIPHLDEGRIKRLAIPWPAQSIRLSIGTNVVKALHLRDEAVDMENKARALVERAIEEGGR